ncbi:hypothetical protein GCM10027514_21550 [Azotobacter armeniacus]
MEFDGYLDAGDCCHAEHGGSGYSPDYPCSIATGGETHIHGLWGGGLQDLPQAVFSCCRSTPYATLFIRISYQPSHWLKWHFTITDESYLPHLRQPISIGNQKAQITGMKKAGDYSTGLSH